tara:strand:+ start:313 stop:657 length:345 start_codon:yes stop_codon:yes gene_type:complete
MGRIGYWSWGVEEIKSQEWVDKNGRRLVGEFLVDGAIYALPLSIIKTDKGNDEIPDIKWTKGDIMSWMDEKDISYSALNTKAKLLAKVQAHLDPAPTEDSMSEGSMEQTTGDEE